MWEICRAGNLQSVCAWPCWTEEEEEAKTFLRCKETWVRCTKTLCPCPVSWEGKEDTLGAADPQQQQQTALEPFLNLVLCISWQSNGETRWHMGLGPHWEMVWVYWDQGQTTGKTSCTPWKPAEPCPSQRQVSNTCGREGEKGGGDTPASKRWWWYLPRARTACLKLVAHSSESLEDHHCLRYWWVFHKRSSSLKTNQEWGQGLGRSWFGTQRVFHLFVPHLWQGNSEIYFLDLSVSNSLFHSCQHPVH